MTAPCVLFWYSWYSVHLLAHMLFGKFGYLTWKHFVGAIEAQSKHRLRIRQHVCVMCVYTRCGWCCYFGCFVEIQSCFFMMICPINL